MRWLLSLPLAVLAVLVSCGDRSVNREDMAARAAEEYYGHLAAGRYDGYLAGVWGADSLPVSYREQLLTNARQFAAAQSDAHGGISEVRAVNAVTDSLTGRTDVFLMLCFGDSVKEEIVVPMIESGGRWMMR